MTDRLPGFNTLAIHAGAAPGRGDGRAGDADLPDHLVRVRRRRPRRLAVRAAGLRQHLFAHRQPDLRGAGGAGRGARGRHGGARGGFRPRGGVPGLPRAAAARRRVRGGAQALRRLDQPVQPFLQELRLERGLGGFGRARDLRGRDHAEDQGDLRRIDRQSGRRDRRSRGASRRSPRSTASRSSSTTPWRRPT